MTAVRVISNYEELQNLPAEHVKAHGAKGDGITDDTIAIRAAITAAGANGSVFFPAGTYLISGTLQLLAGQRVIGSGATIKRANQVATTTTTPITAGTTTQVTLTSVAGFRVGMNVAFSDAGTTLGNLSASVTLDTTNSQITAINGNTITLSGAPNCTLPAGANCWTSFNCMPLADDCRVSDLAFDGNMANWPFHRWEVTHEIGTSGGNRCVIDGVKINNAPGEGIYVEGLYHTVRACTLTTLNGNGVHLSGATHPVIDGCTVINPNQDTNTGHANGCVIWSNGISDATCVKNDLSGGLAGFGSIDSSDNSDITLSDNTIRGCTLYGIGMANSTLNNYAKRVLVRGNRIYNCGAVEGGGMTINCVGTTDQVQHVLIEGNYFDTCGLAITSQNPLDAALPPNRITVQGNHFVGCDIQTQGADRIAIRNNVIDRTGDSTGGHYCINNVSVLTNSVIQHNILLGGDRSIFFGSTATDVDVDGNQCAGPATTAISVNGATRLALRDNSIDKSTDTAAGTMHVCILLGGTINQCRVIDNKTIGGDFGIDTGAITDTTISRNMTLLAGTSGINISGTITDCEISHNHVDKTGDTTHNAIALNALVRSRVIGNEALGGANGIEESATGCSDSVIAQNNCYGQFATGIAWNANASAPGCIIEGNTIRNAAGCASSWIGIDCRSQDLMVRGNRITNFGTTANGDIGIWVANGGPDYIDGNVVEGVWSAGSINIYAGNAGSVVQNNIATAAIIDSGTGTIKVNNSDGGTGPAVLNALSSVMSATATAAAQRTALGLGTAATANTTAFDAAGAAAAAQAASAPINDARFTTITGNNQTGTTYTLVASDAGGVVECNNAAGIALTIPPVASVAWAVGTVIELWQQGAGQITVTAGAGVTLLSDGGKVKTAAQYATIRLRMRAADTWVISGDLA